MVGKRSFAYANSTFLTAVRSRWDILLPQMYDTVLLVKTKVSKILGRRCSRICCKKWIFTNYHLCFSASIVQFIFFFSLLLMLRRAFIRQFTPLCEKKCETLCNNARPLKLKLGVVAKKCASYLLTCRGTRYVVLPACCFELGKYLKWLTGMPYQLPGAVMSSHLISGCRFYMCISLSGTGRNVLR